MKYHNDEQINRAFTAYYRRFGKDAQQPSASDVERTTHSITLRNSKGVLAVYRIAKERPASGYQLYFSEQATNDAIARHDDPRFVKWYA